VQVEEEEQGGGGGGGGGGEHSMPPSTLMEGQELAELVNGVLIGAQHVHFSLKYLTAGTKICNVCVCSHNAARRAVVHERVGQAHV
jgi:hypothetical protein